MKDSYSLRQVVDLTGLSEFTLRGWENRYKAFTPRRTSTGRRQYSANDLQKAMLLRELLKRGHRIGDIAHLSTKKLGEMMDVAYVEQNPSPAPSEAVDNAIKLMALQKWNELESHLSRESRGPTLAVLRKFIFPLMQEMGRSVGQGVVTIAQEHIFSAMLKEQMYMLKARAPKPRADGARFVVASPEGDFHDLGILACHVLLSLHGFHTLLVGCNSPKNELSETALRFDASHVLIGSTVSRREGAKEDLGTIIHFLDKNLPADLAIWVGGRNTSGLRLELARPFQCIFSMQHLDEQIGELI
jgi:DNA-binding transcriptional MerR regulator/methylmalonyl-CoA mutase cobalamin-binding subunit